VGLDAGGGPGAIDAMSEARIGRVLVASMHQAIQDLLPERLDFYENWLSTAGLREGTIGLAPLAAVLSFLRQEGDAYTSITTRAGEYAADWTIEGMPSMERRILRALPERWRTRGALRVARELVSTTYPGTRTLMKVRRRTALIDLRGSLFCEVREVSVLPLCGFYAAAVARVLAHFALPVEVQVNACRAAGAQRGCILTVVLQNGASESRATA
jgi:hypothetical protein